MKCVWFQRGLIVAKDIGSFFIYVDTWGERAMPIDYRGSGYHMRSRLSVPHSQSIHPPKMASKPWNRMAYRRYTRDLLVKPTGLISKNDMISMRSPSSNAKIWDHRTRFLAKLYWMVIWSHFEPSLMPY